MCLFVGDSRIDNYVDSSVKSTLMVWFAMKHQPVLSGQERIKLDYNQETDGRERES